MRFGWVVCGGVVWGVCHIPPFPHGASGSGSPSPQGTHGLCQVAPWAVHSSN